MFSPAEHAEAHSPVNIHMDIHTYTERSDSQFCGTHFQTRLCLAEILTGTH